MILILLLIPCILFIGLIVLNLLTINLFLILKTWFIITVALILFICLYYKYRYPKLPFYNPISKVIELHIGITGSFTKEVRKSIRLSKNIKRNIIFYTNHFSEERLLKSLRGKIIIKKPNLIQKGIFYFTLSLLKIFCIILKLFGKKDLNYPNKRFPVLYCEILYDKL